MEKRQITNISATCIIYRLANPAEVFIEVKDYGYPFPNFKGRYCIIGGNWIGEKALADKNTLATARRELEEELTFDRPLIDSSEYEKLGFGPHSSYAALGTKRAPTEGDIDTLRWVKDAISAAMNPFGDYLQIVPTEIHDGKKPGSITLCSYFSSGLEEELWLSLAELQREFGNLSNESVTIMTDANEMIQKNLMGIWGHDQALRKFLISKDVENAVNLPCLLGITLEEVGPPLSTYEEYFERFDVAKRPTPVPA